MEVNVKVSIGFNSELMALVGKVLSGVGQVVQPQTVQAVPITQSVRAQTQNTVPPQMVQAVPVTQNIQPQTVQAPVIVPTMETQYTIDQLALAATQLVDIGKRDVLIGLLQKFSVSSLHSLPKEHFGLFATELRQLGAQI